MDSPVRLAVAGNPIAHSMSPDLFSAVLPDGGFYTRILASHADELRQICHELALTGLNITSPLKERALSCADQISAHAQEVGALNTITFKNGIMRGHNTDTDGILGALRERGVNAAAKRVAILGAGGAARAALSAMRDIGAQVTLLNRSHNKARTLAATWNAKAVELCHLHEVLRDIDIFIPTVPALDGEPLTVPLNCIVLDSNYKHSIVANRSDLTCYIGGDVWLRHQAIAAAKLFGLSHAMSTPEGVMRAPNSISLIGFMGAGKTSVGRLLAARAAMRFVDLDAEVERVSGESIEALFGRGESAFRDAETKALRQISWDKPMVLATGGGMIERTENRAIIQENSMPIWLVAPFETMLSRVAGTNRPLLLQEDNSEALRKLWERRIDLYGKTSHFIARSSCDIESVVDNISSEISRLRGENHE